MRKCYFTTVLLISAAILLIGCGSFPMHNIPNVGEVSRLGTDSKNNPIVFLEYKRLSGKPGDKANPLEVPQTERQYVYNIIKNTGLFSKVIFDEFEKDKADYVLEIKSYEYSENPGLGILKAIITGLSLMIIPTSYDFMLVTNTRIIDAKGTTIYEYANMDGITWWMGIFVIPFGDKGINRNYVVANLIKDSMVHLSNSHKYELMINKP